MLKTKRMENKNPHHKATEPQSYHLLVNDWSWSLTSAFGSLGTIPTIVLLSVFLPSNRLFTIFMLKTVRKNILSSRKTKRQEAPNRSVTRAPHGDPVRHEDFLLCHDCRVPLEALLPRLHKSHPGTLDFAKRMLLCEFTSVDLHNSIQINKKLDILSHISHWDSH